MGTYNLFARVKRPEHDGCGAEVTEEWIYTFTTSYAFVTWAGIILTLNLLAPTTVGARINP